MGPRVPPHDPPQLPGAGSVGGLPAADARPGERLRADSPDPRHGDVVAIDGRKAVFLYRRGRAAIVRFDTGGDSRVVPYAKLKRAS